MKFFDAGRVDIAADVTRDYLEHLFSTVKNCQCCGKSLHLAYRPRPLKKYRGDPDAPSIDRVNNEKGYRRDNLAVVCWECNCRKSTLTLAHLLQLVTYVTAYGLFDDQTHTGGAS